ncbi:MAG: hypothetical protein ACRESZ_01580 [Methylococcales bacterium]
MLINLQVRHTRRERVSIAMDGNLKPIHGVWIPAIPRQSRPGQALPE